MAEANLLVPLPDDMARLMKLTKWQAAEIQRLRERVFELETDPHGGDVIPLAQPRDGELRRHCRRPPTQPEADRDAGYRVGTGHTEGMTMDTKQKAAMDAGVQYGMQVLKTMPNKEDRLALEANITGVLIVFCGALWGTFGTEYARGFIEAQLRGMGDDKERETFIEPRVQ